VVTKLDKRDEVGKATSHITCLVSARLGIWDLIRARACLNPSAHDCFHTNEALSCVDAPKISTPRGREYRIFTTHDDPPLDDQPPTYDTPQPTQWPSSTIRYLSKFHFLEIWDLGEGEILAASWGGHWSRWGRDSTFGGEIFKSWRFETIWRIVTNVNFQLHSKSQTTTSESSGRLVSALTSISPAASSAEGVPGLPRLLLLPPAQSTS